MEINQMSKHTSTGNPITGANKQANKININNSTLNILLKKKNKREQD